MHLAAAADHLDCVDRLLEAGADPSTADQWGRTPMHRAAENGHLACVDRLLDAGADHSTASDEGMTPMYFAAHNGSVACVNAKARCAGWPMLSPTSSGICRRKARLRSGVFSGTWSRCYQPINCSHICERICKRL